MPTQKSFEEEVEEIDRLSRLIYEADHEIGRLRKEAEEAKKAAQRLYEHRARMKGKLKRLNAKFEDRYAPVPPVELGYFLTDKELASARVRGIDLTPYAEAGLLPD